MTRDIEALKAEVKRKSVEKREEETAGETG